MRWVGLRHPEAVTAHGEVEIAHAKALARGVMVEGSLNLRPQAPEGKKEPSMDEALGQELLVIHGPGIEVHLEVCGHVSPLVCEDYVVALGPHVA